MILVAQARIKEIVLKDPAVTRVLVTDMTTHAILLFFRREGIFETNSCEQLLVFS